jgi:competence protein ComGC
MQKRSAFTIAELLIVACILLVTMALLAPFVQMTKAHAHKIYCANNLRQISLGLHKYAREHNGMFPKSLGELYPGYIKDGGTLDCPSMRYREGKKAPDYIYTQGLTEYSPGKEIIVQDRRDNHKCPDGNVLRVNGSVEWIKL